MTKALFNTLNKEINSRNLPKARVAANKVLNHYRIRVPTNTNDVTRVLYALRLAEMFKQFGNIPNNLSSNILLRIISS